jgi:cell division control protein 6
MLNSEAENKVGTVMVSNQHPRQIDLDPRSQSRLNCQTLEFQSYTAPQLEKILRKRVEQAFRPGTVSDKVVESIAERVAEESGDCREALNLLLRAGRKADRSGRSEVSTDDL